MANAREQNWIENYENLSNYFDEFKKFPTYKKGNDTDINKIAKWVQFQKYSYNKGNLAVERIEKLEELTFWKWSTPNVKHDGYVQSNEEDEEEQEKPKRRTTKKKAETSEEQEKAEKPKRRTTKKKAETSEEEKEKVEKPKRRTTKKKAETSEEQEKAEKPKRRTTKKKAETSEEEKEKEEMEAVVVIEHDGLDDEIVEKSNDIEKIDPIMEFEEEAIVEKEDPIIEDEEEKKTIDDKLSERVSICLDISNLEDVEEIEPQKNYFTIIEDELEKIQDDLNGIMEKTTKTVLEEEVETEIIIEKPKKKNQLIKRKGKKAQ